ncbi:hypothetical protein G7Y89_g5906 [Cudoniella acicularis]|uniref:MAGE domain-containing protein n=1 Tax=Cudoniella acicularis TaxID=354080 RepID=A0A8H4W5A2_9HELO|nr:hypothetical protein G7Y89_g5906 [Cudoniella acicularis]
MPSASRRRRAVVEEEEEEEEDAQSTQHGRRHAPASEDESEEDGEEGGEEDEGESMDVDGDQDNPDQVVKKFVRYALACEFQRVTIKRAALKEKVLGKQRGKFKTIFDKVQKQLRTKFGMEMVELAGKEKTSLAAKRAAAKSKSKGGGSKTTTSWIVVSTLPAAYRTPDIIAPSLIGSEENEATYIGLCTVIVSYIAMSPDGAIPDHKFVRLLKRLNIEENTPLDKTAAILKKMSNQGYIAKDSEKTPDEEIITWRVGPRGMVEIGNRGIQAFVKHVYGAEAPEDLDKRIHRSLNMDMTKIDQVNEDPRAVAEEIGDPGPSTARRASGRRRRGAADDDDDD